MFYQLHNPLPILKGQHNSQKKPALLKAGFDVITTYLIS